MGENLAVAALTLPTSKGTRRKAVRILSISRKGVAQIKIARTIRIIILREMPTTKRTEATGTKTSQCTSRRVLRTEMTRAMRKEARASPMVSNTSRKVRNRITIKRTNLTRSTVIATTITSKIVTVSKEATTSSRIKISQWAECP